MILEPEQLRIEPEPSACTNMTELRKGVDALDRILVRLIAERQRYMDAAARIKPHRELIRDEARIEAVLKNVAAACGEFGLSELIALPVWRTLIESCIAHEARVFDEQRRKD